MANPTRHALLALLALACACSGAADSVCQDIGYCKNLSDDQVSACQANAMQLAAEAAASDCQAAYAAYFSCADDRYACLGNTPAFTGCEAARTALDQCLIAGRANNACGALATGLAACPGGNSATDQAAPPAACGAAEVCAARCYLDEVQPLCKPTPAQIAAAAQCAALCPT